MRPIVSAGSVDAVSGGSDNWAAELLNEEGVEGRAKDSSPKVSLEEALEKALEEALDELGDENDLVEWEDPASFASWSSTCDASRDWLSNASSSELFSSSLSLISSLASSLEEFLLQRRRIENS